MSKESEIILNQAIALSVLYKELSKLTGKNSVSIMELTCANIAKVKPNLGDLAIARFYQQAQLEADFVEEYLRDISD